MSMTLQAGNAQHIGGRSSQQDAFGFSDPSDAAFFKHGGLLGVVADGMGGLVHGDAASRTAVKAMLDAYMHKTTAEPILDALWRSLHAASSALQVLSERLGDIGTTLLAAVVADASLYWISVGDSALLLLRGGVIRQLNTMHTFGRHLDAPGQHPESESLTSFLGASSPAEVDAIGPYPLDAEDRIILCSDGLSKVVCNSETATLALGHPQDASERLVSRARELGGRQQDNVTVLIFSL
jgi:serine/threonine protein phosphatase PrpC